MAFQFSFGGQDDIIADEKVTPTPTVPETQTRPVKEHDLQELVGMSFYLRLLDCAAQEATPMAHLLG